MIRIVIKKIQEFKLCGSAVKNQTLTKDNDILENNADQLNFYLEKSLISKDIMMVIIP